MDTVLVIQDVTYEIHRSFVGEQTISQRIQEIIAKGESSADSLTTRVPVQYNGTSGSVLTKEVTT